MTQTRGALLTPGASRWRSVTTQPCREPRKLGLGSVVQTENRCYPCRREANIKPSMLCMLRKKAFHFRFTPDSLEMGLETPLVTELGTMAFYSLKKCFPNPSSITFCLPSGLILWLNAWKTKQQGQTTPFSCTVVCPIFQNQMVLLPKYKCVHVCIWMYSTNIYFCSKERNILVHANKIKKHMSFLWTKANVFGQYF